MAGTGRRCSRSMPSMANCASPSRSRSSVDDTVASFDDALGPSVRLHRVMGLGGAIGAVGRWRHGGACVDLSRVGTTQIVFNLRGEQTLEWRQDVDVTRGVACCGSASVVGQDTTAHLSIFGLADTIQIVLDPGLFPPASVGPFPSTNRREQSLQALSAQALVALAMDDAERLGRTVSAAGAAMIAHAATPSRLARGGLGRRSRADKGLGGEGTARATGTVAERGRARPSVGSEPLPLHQGLQSQ